MKGSKCFLKLLVTAVEMRPLFFSLSSFIERILVGLTLSFTKPHMKKSVHLVYVQENFHPINTAHSRTSVKARYQAGMCCSETLVTVEWQKFLHVPGKAPVILFSMKKNRGYNSINHIPPTPNI